jgi:hypothetical protein
MTVGVLDGPGLARLFRQLAGRRLLGVIDTGDVLELVFDDEEGAGNLVSIYYDAARYTGLVALGGVQEPEAYVADWREAA